jgi:NADP-dependent 3-hydroxy acid dehydrogenase YdfG
VGRDGRQRPYLFAVGLSPGSAVPQLAVVTGASQGIGRAVVERLVLAGFTVWAVGRHPEALGQLMASNPYGSIVPCVLDVGAATDAELEGALGRLRAPVRALVHCAGVLATGSLATADPVRVLEAMQTNAVGPLRLTRYLLPVLGPGSRVVFINSSQGLVATGGTGAYAASKHALKGFADSLRADVSDIGIRVSSVYLGRTATHMQEVLYAERGEEYHPELLLQPDTVAGVVHALVTLPDDAEVTDIMLRPAIKSY